MRGMQEVLHNCGCRDKGANDDDDAGGSCLHDMFQSI